LCIFVAKYGLLKNTLLLLFLFLTTFGYSQNKPKKIKIIFSNYSYFDENKFPGATIFLGNVKMAHEGAILECKKALYYKEKNFFKALGNVIIKQGDTITQTSDYTDYDGNSKQALSWGNVVLKDPEMTLTTDTLHFDRLNQKLYYQNFATIKDQTNILKSKKGNYYLENKKFTATNTVTVVNPEHFLESNHLDYYTNSGLAYLYGASTITNSKNKNKIYCERGFYDTKTDISYFVKNAKLFLKDRTITGDSLYYDKRKGFASATNNIKIIDTVQNFVTKGNYAEIFEHKDSLFIIKRAVAISLMEKDSMYVHGDTILVTGKAKHRIVRTYHNVKIFKSDLQGKCDSLHTDQSTGLTRMFKNPVLWSGKNQITGDSIHLISNPKTEKLDSLKILNNALIIEKDSLAKNIFNQIKGRNMYGKFFENKLKTLYVKGNAEALNFNRNEQQVLETITKQLCSNIEFELENNEVIYIKCFKKTEGKTFPPSLFPEKDRKLKGFVWREKEQPKTMEDIFIEDKKTTLKTKNKKEKKLPLKPKLKNKKALPKRKIDKELKIGVKRKN